MFFFCIFSTTFILGDRVRFNNQLNSTDKRYTYFVPSDVAWTNAEIKSPSAYKKLFMAEFSYHVSERFIFYFFLLQKNEN